MLLPAARLGMPAVLLLSAVACVSFHKQPQAARSLTPTEIAQSQAWAHYSHGLLLEADSSEENHSSSEAYKKAHKLDPSASQPAEALALKLLQQSRIDEALAVLEARCKAEPDNAQAHLTMARIAEMCGSNKIAAKHFKRALEIDDRDVNSGLSAVRALINDQQDKAAIREMGRLYRLYPSEITRQAPEYWCVQLVGQTNSSSRAIPYTELAASWATNSTQQAFFWTVAGELLIKEDKTKAALKAFKNALRCDPQHIPAMRGIGESLVKNGNRKAIFYLTMSSRAKNFTRQIQNHMIALFALKKIEDLDLYRQTLRDLNKILKNNADQKISEHFYLYFGGLLDEQELDVEAENIFLSALAIYPDSHLIMNHLSYMWAVNNVNLEQAEKYSRKSLELEPDNGAYLDTLGWIYYRQKKFHDALAQLINALGFTDDDPTVLDHTGDVLFALGRESEAGAFWARSFVIDNNQSDLREKLEKHGVKIESLRIHE